MTSISIPIPIVARNRPAVRGRPGGKSSCTPPNDCIAAFTGVLLCPEKCRPMMHEKPGPMRQIRSRKRRLKAEVRGTVAVA